MWGLALNLFLLREEPWHMGLDYYGTSKTLSQVIMYEMRCFPSSKKIHP